jgi:hypothetical protein
MPDLDAAILGNTQLLRHGRVFGYKTDFMSCRLQFNHEFSFPVLHSLDLLVQACHPTSEFTLCV